MIKKERRKMEVPGRWKKLHNEELHEILLG
jgi:hypothetical protein